MQAVRVHEYNPAVSAIPGPNSNPMSAEGTNVAGGGVKGRPMTDNLDHHGGIGGANADSVMGNNLPNKTCIGGDGHGGKC